MSDNAQQTKVNQGALRITLVKTFSSTVPGLKFVGQDVLGFNMWAPDTGAKIGYSASLEFQREYRRTNATWQNSEIHEGLTMLKMLRHSLARNERRTVVDLANFCPVPCFMSSRKQKALTLEVKAIIRVHLPLSYSPSQWLDQER